MMESLGMMITDRGMALQMKAQAGAVLQYTRIGLGSGIAASADDVADMNALVSEMHSLPVGPAVVDSPSTVRVTAILSNENLETGFTVTEIGVFAEDPDDGEILYAYTMALDMQSGTYIPSGGGPTLLEQTLNFIVAVANAENIVISNVGTDGYVSQESLQIKLEDYQHRDEKNQPNGYAGLDETGQLPTSIAPAMIAENVTLGPISGMTSENVQTGIQELFTFASDGKATVAGAIGAPAIAGNTFAQLAGHVNTARGTLATNLTAKNVAATQSEPLQTLAAKVASININGVPRFGTGADGPLDTQSNTVLPVPTGQKWGFQYRPIVKQYTTFRIRAGATLSLERPACCLVIMATEAIIIEGALEVSQNGQYVDIDPEIINLLMPMMNATQRYPIPANGAGGKGGNGGIRNTAPTAIPQGGAASSEFGVNPGNTTPGKGGHGVEPQAYSGQPGFKNWSALPGGGASGSGGNDANRGGGGGSINGAGSAGGYYAGAPGAQSTILTGGAGCNLILTAPRIIISGAVRSNGRNGYAGGVGGGAAGSNDSAGGGGSGGAAGGGIDIYYKDEYTKTGTVISTPGTGGQGGGVQGGSAYGAGQAGAAGTAGSIRATKLT